MISQEDITTLKNDGIPTPTKPTPHKISMVEGIMNRINVIRKIVAITILMLIMSIVYYTTMNDTVTKVMGSGDIWNSLLFSWISSVGLFGDKSIRETSGVKAKVIVLCHTTLTLFMIALL